MAVVAALAVASTGCVKIDMDLTVTSDDTVDGAMILAVDRSLAELSDMSDEEIREELQRDLETGEFPEDARVEPYEDDNFIGSRVVFEDIPLDEFSNDASGDDLSIVHEDGKYTVSGALDMSTDGVEDIPFDELSAGGAEMQIRITLPGDVIEHNGELSGRTVTWRPEFGKRNEIIAVAKEESGIPTWIWPLLGLAALGVAAIFLVQMRKPRRSTKPPVTDAAPPGSDPGA